ncbi:MAG: cbb3-type cytochrome oxidase assembly protein CcoS [Planctomycetota bacterium]
MSVLYIALPIALLLGFSSLVACIGCLKTGQFDDLDAPAFRILVDEQPNHVKRGEIDG